MSDDAIRAIPTIMNGIKYKSRLEARFAQWTLQNSVPRLTTIIHEPHRLGQNQYLPDFLIKGLDGDEVYIEVKPLNYACETWIALDAARETGDSLMVVDEFSRNVWGCFASVWNSELDFYTTLIAQVLRITIPAERGRPVFFYNRFVV